MGPENPRKDNKDVAELLFERGAEVNKQAEPRFPLQGGSFNP